MIPFTIIILILSSCKNNDSLFQKLSWHSSLEVLPETRVYYDISSYNEGDLISFKIYMDYFGSFSQKGIYRFKIDQVPTSNQFDEEYWKNLRSVTNKNVSYSGHFQDFCTFSWDETKKKGNNFIFIYLPTPFQDFNSFWKRKIKIENVGISIGGIIGIIVGCAVFVAILITIIICWVKRRNTFYSRGQIPNTIIPEFNNILRAPSNKYAAPLPNSEPAYPDYQNVMTPILKS